MWRSTVLLLGLITATVAGLYQLVNNQPQLPDDGSAIHVRTAQVQFPGAAWQSVDLPMDWRAHPAAQEQRQASYQFDVNLQVPPNRLWGLLLTTVEQNIQVALNGEVIGAPGTLRPYPSRFSQQSLYFVLPNGVLRPGRNTFSIDLHTFPPGRGFLGPILLGPDAVLRPQHEQATFIRRDLVWFFAALSLAMTIVIGILAWQRRQQPEYAWFTAVCGLWTLQTANAMVIDPPISTPVAIALTSVAAAWFCMCTYFFALRFINIRMPRFERLMLISTIAGTAGVAAAIGIAPQQAYAVAPASTLLLMAYGPIVVYQAIRQFIVTRDPEVFLLLYAAGIIMVLGAFSIAVATGTSSGARGQYLFYVTPIVLGIFVLHLLRRFLAAMRESEMLNKDLEARVADKTQQLEANFARLNELEKERAIALERERLMRDMHDGVGGQLVSSIMRLKAGDQPDAVRSSLEHALTDLRMMIDSLEASNDLNTALGMLRQRLREQLNSVGINVIWHADEIPPSAAINAHTTLQVMRIVQEAFANVLKHADASEIRFDLRCSGRDVVLCVTDNGRGFKMPPRDGNGHGLNNMHRRAASIGGELNISSDDPGCRVELRLPLQL